MHKLKTAAILVAAGLAASGMLTGAAQAQDAEETFDWRMATSWSGGELMEWGARAFAEKIDLFSNGRISVEVFPAGTLGKALNISETVGSGIAELGHTSMNYEWGTDPTAVLFAGYAGGLNDELMLHWLFAGDGFALWREYRAEAYGVIGMPCLVRPAEVFLHSRKPVRTLDDLRGLKIRTAGMWVEVLNKLGAAPVTLAGGEVFAALERGVIDATEWGTLSENLPTGFHQIARYVVLPGVHQPVAPMELLVNKEAWPSLDERDQRLIEEACKLVSFESWVKYGENDSKALQQYVAAGNEILRLDDETKTEARALAQDWADKVAQENEWFAKVLQNQRDFEQRWEAADIYRNVLN